MDNTEKEYIEKHSKKYSRVGTQFLKTVYVPDAHGGKNKTMLPWNKATIISDYGKKVLDNIKKYDGFICIPDHLNYQQEIDGFYNDYSPLPISIQEAGAYNLKELEALITTSLGFMEHIFGEQLNLGLDYLKILLEKPTQILPILSLVSSERSTGKSTFLKWIRVLFGLNMTYVKGDSFSSQFNADWGGKLIVAIDEVFFDKKEITERLKFLSTATSDKVEAKGNDRREIASFYKFLLCSNNETSFLIIDENETRVWVRKIKPLIKEDVNHLNKLEKEELSSF